MIQEFIENGYEIVEHTKKADIYIVNTCTVTNMSDRKSRQMLRRVKELNSNAIIVACGCYAQVAQKELENIKEIDLVLGNNEKKDIVKYVENFINTQTPEIKADDLMKQKEFVEFGNVTFTEKTRAVIKVQDGCDRFCSYCIIPYARGRVRSRQPKHIISEIEKIANEGIKEVVITGIHIASYGKDFSEYYKLIELSNKNQHEYNEKYVGQEVEVLFEEKKDGIYKGHTKNYILVHCLTDENLENKIVKIKCKKAEKEYIIAG